MEPVYLPPSWIGVDYHHTLDLTDSRDGARLELSGSLREAFFAGKFLQQPATATLGRLNPVMERLISSLIIADPMPLDRHRLLRGNGWSRLFIELTGRCNERCTHCYAEASPDVTSSLDQETVFSLLAHANELGFTSVQLTGGDPLLSDVCLPAAQRATELGFPMVEIYTNGLALKGALFDQLSKLKVAFAFSIYGQDSLVHDTVTRTAGSLRRTLDAVEKCVNADLPFRIGIINTGTTGFSLPATMELLANLGVPTHAISADIEREVGRGVGLATASEQTEESTLPLPAKELPPLSARDLNGAFSGTAAVSYDGQVFPCIFSRKLPLGDVYLESLSDILQKPLPINQQVTDILEAADSWSGSLTCRNCRLRAVMLSGENPDV